MKAVRIVLHPSLSQAFPGLPPLQIATLNASGVRSRLLEYPPLPRAIKAGPQIRKWAPTNTPLRKSRLWMRHRFTAVAA